MPFEPNTIIASAAAGGLAGLILASWRVDREERAKRRVLAQDRVEEAAGELLAQAVAYQAQLVPGRSDASQWMSDYIWASKVLVASRGLGRVRRWLLDRRLKELVGPVAFNIAVAKPASEKGEDIMGTAIIGMIHAHRDEKYADGIPKGFLEIALRQPPDSKEVRKAIRLLRRVSRTTLLWF
ncbi:hypothetical protein [Lentzea aerocolonigenes]|uniref:hypothetical protein n=1 Tax=Lentzea aerocolonigenes TaxID=68170 RepID=UPI0004C38AD7|nr:hypothetical protein [Lentzea aerocolonigenes]MCP2248751.1 hypothetical protein [Lentzea aerocolonigenes]